MIGSLIHAGALFEIEPATLRVAATRLLKEGLLESPERGVYVPGPKARARRSAPTGFRPIWSARCFWSPRSA